MPATDKRADTFMFFVANRFDPDHVGIKNFKRDYGFTQGKGKWGSEVIRQKLSEVDDAFNKNSPNSQIVRGDIDSDEDELDEVDTVNVDIVKQKVEYCCPAPFIIPEGEGVIVEIHRI